MINVDIPFYHTILSYEKKPTCFSKKKKKKKRKEAYLGVSVTVAIIMCHQTILDIKLDLCATTKQT